MIIWGGDRGGYCLNTGAVALHELFRWTPTSMGDVASARHGHTAVWAGSDMIVWGGRSSNGSALNTGYIYNIGTISPTVITDAWFQMTANNSPAARYGHTAVWTGRGMIIWGGKTGMVTNSGAMHIYLLTRLDAPHEGNYQSWRYQHPNNL
ncbi:hypothetical protein ES708_25217 [subsurface metagenome]